jgi:hypothetical protein
VTTRKVQTQSTQAGSANILITNCYNFPAFLATSQSVASPGDLVALNTGGPTPYMYDVTLTQQSGGVSPVPGFPNIPAGPGGAGGLGLIAVWWTVNNALSLATGLGSFNLIDTTLTAAAPSTLPTVFTVSITPSPVSGRLGISIYLLYQYFIVSRPQLRQSRRQQAR